MFVIKLLYASMKVMLDGRFCFFASFVPRDMMPTWIGDRAQPASQQSLS